MFPLEGVGLPRVAPANSIAYGSEALYSRPGRTRVHGDMSA